MVQFIGCHFQEDRVYTTVIDRKTNLLQASSVSIPGLKPTDSAGVFEVPQQEWIRSGTLALGDAYSDLPVKHRKIWGIGFAAPQGWIALDPDLKPLSPLRLTPGKNPLEDFRAWLEKEPKAKQHILSVLTPKDYFRLKISGAFAGDITQAAQTGMVQSGSSFWKNDTDFFDKNLEKNWFPPIFDSWATTGKLTEEGIDLTGIPGGIWLVAGCDSSAASELAAGDLGEDELFVLLEKNRIIFRIRFSNPTPLSPPSPWQETPQPLTGFPCWIRTMETDGEDLSLAPALQKALEELTGGDSANSNLEIQSIVLDTRQELTDAWNWEEIIGQEGLSDSFSEALSEMEVSWSPFAESPDPGCAFLAGRSKNAFHDAKDLYKKLHRMLDQHFSNENDTDSTQEAS